jgi:histidine triad (HIT) family protein
VKCCVGSWLPGSVLGVGCWTTRVSCRWKDWLESNDGLTQMSESSCVFCGIALGQMQASVVYADQLVVGFMDINPVNPGHVLVIPRQHYTFLSDLPEAIGARIFAVTQGLAAALRRSGVRCEGINLFLADGEVAFQEVFHCHMHVFPRFVGDAFRIDANWSTHPPREELDALAQQIRTAYEEVANQAPSSEET